MALSAITPAYRMEKVRVKKQSFVNFFETYCTIGPIGMEMGRFPSLIMKSDLNFLKKKLLRLHHWNFSWKEKKKGEETWRKFLEDGGRRKLTSCDLTRRSQDQDSWQASSIEVWDGVCCPSDPCSISSHLKRDRNEISTGQLYRSLIVLFDVCFEGEFDSRIEERERRWRGGGKVRWRKSFCGRR